MIKKRKKLLLTILFLTIISSINAQRVRLSFDLGFAYRTAEVPDNAPKQIEDYIDSLRGGLDFGIKGSYLISETLALGLNYNQYTTSGSLRVNGINTSDDIAIKFFGPEVVAFIPTNLEKHSFVGSFSLGYLSLKNDSTLNGGALQISGSTIGFSGNFGYEYRISEKVGLGIDLGYVAGALNKLEVSANGQKETLDEDDGFEKENLGRFKISGGLRLYL